ncbi:MAG TPA: DUF2062 domain-containing protein, partial [Pirellula sp.]|nr:DUF2062 domain-containing protein [Pirellula sp.]
LKNIVGAMFPRTSMNSERIIAILAKNRNPNHLAWGIAIGIMLGLIPKDNLVVLSLVVVLACIRVNQLVTGCTAVSLSFLAGWFYPLTTYFGSLLLSQPRIANGIFYLYHFPMLSWTRLENALVIGGIGLGLAAILPAYAVCRWSKFKARQKLQSIELEQVANQTIQYRKSVADQSRSRQEKLIPSLKLLSVDTSVARDSRGTIHAESAGVTSNPTEPTYISSTSRVLQVITDADAKKLDPESLKWANRSKRQRKVPMIFTDEVLSAGNDTFLRETVIEVVRYRRPVNSTRESLKSKPDSAASSLSQGNFMPVGNASTSDTKKIVNLGAPASKMTGPDGQSISFDTSHLSSQVNGRDEALRYLLWHINGSRASVRKQSEKTA